MSPRQRAPDRAAAFDPKVVLHLLGGGVRSWAGFDPATCAVTLVKEHHRRLVVRYDLEGAGRRATVVGKWYGTDRDRVVVGELRALAGLGFDREPLRVPRLVAHAPEHRVLFVEWIDGPLLREALRTDPEATSAAGRWLARFHRSGVSSPRRCGPEKQLRAVHRWSERSPTLRGAADRLVAALARLEDPGLPVHYDYYHSQILVPSGRTVVLDLDEMGLGDPGFDLAHFEAHLELLALQWFADPTAFHPTAAAFRRGYREGGGDVAVVPPLRAFAWFKLADQAIRRGGPGGELDYALGAVERSLSSS